MRVFLTKTWGFSEPVGPLQFGAEGHRQSAISALADGDLVVIVGTLGEPTIESERGRILGLMQPSRRPVQSLAYALQRKDGDLNGTGDYKWPYGLELEKAWRFSDPRPLLKDVTDRRFNMDAANGIVPLTAPEAEAILALPRREVVLLSPIAARARIIGHQVATRQASPMPTTTRTGIMHVRRAPAFTYAMSLLGAKQTSFKIGWAFDWRARQRVFNRHSLPGLGGISYEAKLTHLFDTAMDAFRMEQSLLERFQTCRHPLNHEVICGVDLRAIESAWTTYLANVMRNPQAARNSTPTPSARKASR